MQSAQACKLVDLRPLDMSPLDKAIFAAKDAWFLADRVSNQAATAEGAVKSFLAQRDKHRKECGRQLSIAKKLHAASAVNVPWKEWAPLQTGWSYMTITRRMKDFAKPEVPKKRRSAPNTDESKPLFDITPIGV